MRRLLLLCLAVSCSACEGGDPAPNGSTPAQEVPVGTLPAGTVDVHDFVQNLDVPGIQAEVVAQDSPALLLLRIDPRQLEPVLIGAPLSGISASDAMADNNLSVVIGSGFVSDLNSLTPVGLLQIDGRTLNPVQGHGYTRILGINDNGMGVVHRQAFHSALFHSALQAGPGIVEDGQLDISSRDLQRPKYFRSFVAVCDDSWLAGVSLVPSHLRTLGETLLAHLRAQQVQCDEVVNLAGDRQAVLLIKNQQQRILFHGDPNTYKVSLVGFRRL